MLGIILLPILPALRAELNDVPRQDGCSETLASAG